MAVWDAWEKSGRVVQIGVQRTSDPRWQAAYRFLCEGRIGKVVQIQTEYYRNSRVGQWRYYRLTPEMTPREYQLAEIPGGGGRSWLRPCRLTGLISPSGAATGLSVMGFSAICLYTVSLGCCWRPDCDFLVVSSPVEGFSWSTTGRQVPDTVTLVADFDEGCNCWLLPRCSMPTPWNTAFVDSSAR